MTTDVGWIYTLTNETMPGLVKLGMTLTEDKRPEDRAKELFTTSVALPFNVEFAKLVKDPQGTEKKLHNILENISERINNRREFFRVSPSIVRMLFDLVDGEMWSSSTPTENIIDINNVNLIEDNVNVKKAQIKPFVIKKSRTTKQYIVSKPKKSRITKQCVKENLSIIKETLSDVNINVEHRVSLIENTL
jgi:hypothetical protein